MEISLERLIAQARNLATPIDFETLIRDGVLEQAKRRGWYRVKDWDRFPEHARAKVSEITNTGEVKFRKPSKKMQRLADKLSRERP